MSQNESADTNGDASESTSRGGSPQTDGAEVNEPAEETTKRLERLRAENERLRETLTETTTKRYRVTAIGFAIVGAIALGASAVFPAERTVLLALGGTGLFGAVLTYVLTPERFVSAAVGERIYRTLAENEAAIVDDLALEGDPVIVPTGERTTAVRLFVPQTATMHPPSADELSVPFVTGSTQGLSLEPTGAALYAALRAANAPMQGEPGGIAATVGDALVEQFELIDAVDIDAGPGRITMAVDGSAYGPVDRFDHPAASLLATALAIELNTPVTPTVAAGERAEWLITCRFDETAVESGETAV